MQDIQQEQLKNKWGSAWNRKEWENYNTAHNILYTSIKVFSWAAEVCQLKKVFWCSLVSSFISDNC